VNKEIIHINDKMGDTNEKILLISMLFLLLMEGCSSNSQSANKSDGNEPKIKVPDSYVAMTAPKMLETVTVDQVTYQLYDDMTAVIKKGELIGAGEHVLPNNVNGYKVKTIDIFAFKEGKAEGHIVLPDTLEIVSYGAFQDCPKLIAITIPESVFQIDDYAFLKCIGLEEVIVPKTVQYLGAGAFSDCDNLKKATILGGYSVRKDTLDTV